MDYLSEFLLLQGKMKDKGDNVRRAKKLQQQGFVNIFNMMCADKASSFKWNSSHMPNTIDTEVIERGIIYEGMVALSKDLKYEYSGYPFACRVTGLNNLSFYGHPTSCVLSDWAGRVLGTYIPVLDSDIEPIMINPCAIIYDNPQHHAPIYTILWYCERLVVINTAIDACIRNITGTSLLLVPKEKQEMAERMYKTASTGVPLIIGYDYMEGQDTEIARMLSTAGASDELKILLETYDKTYADFLQSVGIRSNNEIDKKSGVNPMEILESRQVVDLRLNKCLNSRLEGIERCKRIGIDGLSVSLSNFENRTTQYDATGNKINESEGEKENAQTSQSDVD